MFWRQLDIGGQGSQGRGKLARLRALKVPYKMCQPIYFFDFDPHVYIVLKT